MTGAYVEWIKYIFQLQVSLALFLFLGVAWMSWQYIKRA